MEISAKVVMELRGRTGAGMMDCKKALKETEGDMEKAIDYLREKGLAAAAKKQSRIAAEGLVGSYYCDKCKVGVLVEVNCETDFVAKTPEFSELVTEIAKTVAQADPACVDCLMDAKCASDDSKTISALVTEKTAKIGEKITIRRFARFAGSDKTTIDSYIHMGGTVGVMVELSRPEENAAVKEAAHDIALQIAAAAPEYVRRSEVRAEHLDHEKEVLAAQARNEGKPEKIIEKMVQGRVDKFYKEVCLLEQPFVKNPDESIEKMLAAKCGADVDVIRFVRYKMGDGLEKKVNDLAAEVAEQTAAMKK